MPQTIIISEVPSNNNILENIQINENKTALVNGKLSSVWERWVDALQVFINQYFSIFTIDDPAMGKVPRIAFSIPPMTEADRDALVLPVTGVGLFIFNLDTNKINYYQNGVWAALP